MIEKLRVIIADDERPARSFLKVILQEFEDVEIVGEAENGAEAVEIIKRLKPDLALLDLQMPEITAWKSSKCSRKPRCRSSLSSRLTTNTRCRLLKWARLIILLKPIEKARLRETLQRASEGSNRKNFSCGS